MLIIVTVGNVGVAFLHCGIVMVTKYSPLVITTRHNNCTGMTGSTITWNGFGLDSGLDWTGIIFELCAFYNTILSRLGRWACSAIN